MVSSHCVAYMPGTTCRLHAVRKGTRERVGAKKSRVAGWGTVGGRGGREGGHAVWLHHNGGSQPARPSSSHLSRCAASFGSFRFSSASSWKSSWPLSGRPGPNRCARQCGSCCMTDANSQNASSSGM